MENDNTINISAKGRNRNVNQSGTETSIGTGIEDIGSVNHQSSYRSDQRKNQSKDEKNDRIVSNSDRGNINYSNNITFTHSNQRAAVIEHRNYMSMTQNVRNLGSVPNMSMNFNRQQINALNMPLNVADTINNTNFPRFHNSISVPDINASLSNMNNFSQSNNAAFSTESGLTQHDRNTFTMTEDNSASLYLGGNTSDQYDGGQSGIMNGSLWNVTTALNGRTSNTKIENKNREVEVRGDSELPFAKRMRHSRPQSHITQEAQQQLLTTSDQYGSTSGRSYSLFVERDERNLSQYQCLARMQMEIFEATPEDAGKNAQGRNRPILPGQIGIRCRHCYKLPPKQRKTGSTYYPNRLEGVYQTAQKMTVGHLCKHCTMIPEEIRKRLLFLKDQKSSDGGGKRYWADCVRSLGVIETPYDGLTFEKPFSNTLKRKNNPSGAL